MESYVELARNGKWTMNDREWMHLAEQEAARGGWAVHPNPMVGAILVKDGVELGRGYHHGAGQAHAEVEALRDAARRGHDVRGATIYVTLEPCNHYGRTPPCTEALIAAGISRCVVGPLDTDVRVRGAGIRRLEAAGIPCTVGVCEQELLELNAAFFTRTRDERPFITAKWAMTLDGRTATASGSSQWITGTLAREDVHRERARHDAIMAGTQTLVVDNPQLNVRLDGEYRQPVRVVLDRTLRVPLTHRVFDTSSQRTILFTARTDVAAWLERGVEVENVACDAHGLDLREVLRRLATKYLITTLYCEGGATLHGALFDLGLVDQVHAYIAPKLTGGDQARGCIGGAGVELMSQAHRLEHLEIRPLGDDFRMAGRIRRHEGI